MFKFASAFNAWENQTSQFEEGLAYASIIWSQEFKHGLEGDELNLLLRELRFLPSRPATLPRVREKPENKKMTN